MPTLNSCMNDDLQQWRRLVEDANNDVSSSTTPKAREFRATPDLLDVAVADTQASKHRHDMEADAYGVVPGQLRRLDKKVARGDHTLDDITADWTNTHAFIRNKYGDRVILYRADAPVKEHNPNTLTLFFASKKMAERYNYTDRTVKPYMINTSDIVAVHATKTGYYEVIVRRPKEGIVPLDPEKLSPAVSNISPKNKEE